MKHCHGNGRLATDCHARAIERAFVRGEACSHALCAMALHALERQGSEWSAWRRSSNDGLEASSERPCMQGHTACMYSARSWECMHEREEERKRWMERGREKKQLDAHITCVLSKVVRVCHKYLSIYPIYISLSLSLSYIAYPFCALSLSLSLSLSLALFR